MRCMHCKKPILMPQARALISLYHFLRRSGPDGLTPAEIEALMGKSRNWVRHGLDRLKLRGLATNDRLHRWTALEPTSST